MGLGPTEFIILCIIGMLFLIIPLGVGFGIWFIVKKSNSGTAQSQSNRVPCPYCAELILPGAKICRFCCKDLTNESSN
jgi:hypothetical protein